MDEQTILRIDFVTIITHELQSSLTAIIPSGKLLNSVIFVFEF